MGMGLDEDGLRCVLSEVDVFRVSALFFFLLVFACLERTGFLSVRGRFAAVFSRSTRSPAGGVVSIVAASGTSSISTSEGSPGALWRSDKDTVSCRD